MKIITFLRATLTLGFFLGIAYKACVIAMGFWSMICLHEVFTNPLMGVKDWLFNGAFYGIIFTTCVSFLALSFQKKVKTQDSEEVDA